MPLYTFVNPATNEVRDVFFKMNDVKEYFGDSDEPEVWQRVYHSPNMAMDTNIDPFSQKAFVEKTKNAKTYGQLFDMSKEMSDKRAEKLGADDPQRKKAESTFYKPKKINK